METYREATDEITHSDGSTTPAVAAVAGTYNNTPLGGTVEGALVPPAVRPIVKEISVRPKTIIYPFQVTEIQETLDYNLTR